MDDSSFFTELIYIICRLFRYFIDFLVFCIELRFCIAWFLNINPYFEPFLSLWAFTTPFIWFGKGIYPRFFGVQFAPIMNYKLLSYVQKSLDRVVESIRASKTEGFFVSDSNLDKLHLLKIEDILPVSLHLNSFDNFS